MKLFVVLQSFLEMSHDFESGAHVRVPKAVDSCWCRQLSFCFSRLWRLQGEGSRQCNRLCIFFDYSALEEHDSYVICLSSRGNPLAELL